MTRIAPLELPYAANVEAMLQKWMPPGSPIPPLALFRTFLKHEQLAERMRPLGALFLGKPSIPPRDREILLLRTCARCNSEYEWGVHATAFGAAVGLDEETIAATVTRDLAPTIAPDDAALLRFADELHDTGHVTDATWSAVAGRFTETQLLEMTALCGFYHLISFLTNAPQVEREPWAARFPAA